MSEGRLELLTTVLLALAGIATAWSAYEARQWTGAQAQAYATGNAARLESSRASALANRNGGIDVQTFIQWVDATEQQNPKLARFYRVRFRDEFKPAFAAWVATRPLKNESAPPTPFAMPEYKLAAAQKADRLEVKAAASSNEAKDDNRHANNYMLGTVLLASALFFAGISTRLHTPGSRKAILALGYVLFLGTVVWLATLPIRFTT